MKPESALKLEQRKPSVSKLNEGDPFFGVVENTFHAIGKRAYECFESRGCEPGHELDDWLRAESEILRKAPCEIVEKGNELMVRAEVPGFNQRELQVKLEPNRIFISGHKERLVQSTSEDTIVSDRKDQDVFRELELPVRVNPDKASATLHEGIITVFVQKEMVAAEKAALQAA